MDIIGECKMGIHDISRTSLDDLNQLPRFNMPLELGLFLGAKRFGSLKQRAKKCLILDSQKYRYQRFCSDISGQDIEAHNNNMKQLVTIIRNWLLANHPNSSTWTPSGSKIRTRYDAFCKELPTLYSTVHLSIQEATFHDHIRAITFWIQDNPYHFFS